MQQTFRASLLAAAAVALGVFTWSATAQADATPGCGGAGQPVCTAKPARSHGKARNVGCPSGSFFDPRNFGECWTCSGKVRTVHAVTSASACGSHVFDGSGTRARFVRTVWGCGKGQFFDLVDGGSCWSCPSGRFRGVTHVKSKNACLVSPGLTCDAGMERNGNQCRPSQETQARKEASKVAARHGGAILHAVRLALGLKDDAALLEKLGAKGDAAVGHVLGSAAFKRTKGSRPAVEYETVTVGAATSASLIAVGGSAETGIAIDIDGKRPVYWYASTGYKLGPALSADAGVSVGLWTAQNNALAGDSQGVVLGLADLGKLGKLAEEGLDFKKGFSLAVAVWFSYPDANGNIELLGITVTPGLGVGADLGGYVKATTIQVT